MQSYPLASRGLPHTRAEPPCCRDVNSHGILDLRALNGHLRKYKFRMLTHASLSRLVRQNDWFTSVDLKDTYFRIPTYPPYRKYLQFAFQRVCYEFHVLPFSPSLSPRVFVRCTEAAIAPLRGHPLGYIPGRLVAAPGAGSHSAYVHFITHLWDLGFVINGEKSRLFPAQDVVFLGLVLNSVTFTVRLSVERVKSFRACLELFRLGRIVAHGGYWSHPSAPWRYATGEPCRFWCGGVPMGAIQ